MGTVYSSNFGQLHAFNGLYAFNVPAGQVLVLRDVDLFAPAQIGTEVEVFLQGDLGQTIWYVVADGTTAINEQWRGRQVFGEGQQIYVNVTSGHVDVTLSGYLLSLP